MRPGFPPWLETLDLGGSGYSPWIVEGAVRLGMDLPFTPAAALRAVGVVDSGSGGYG